MFYKFAVFIIKLYTNLFYRMDYRHEESLPTRGPVIFVGKHISNTDVFFVCTHLKCKVFHLAKASLFRKKFYAKVLTALGGLPVTPDTGALSSIRSAISVLKNKEVLCIYPEGTRLRNNELHEGAVGTAMIAKLAKCDVIPFGIYVEDYTVKLFQKVSVRFGKRISFEELAVGSGDKNDYHHAMEHIMVEIKRLSEKDYM